MELSIIFSVVVEAVVGVCVVDDVDDVVSVAEVVVAATNDAVTATKYRESIIFSMAQTRTEMDQTDSDIFVASRRFCRVARHGARRFDPFINMMRCEKHKTDKESTSIRRLFEAHLVACWTSPNMILHDTICN